MKPKGAYKGVAVEQESPVYDRAAAERHFKRTLGLPRRNVRKS